MSDNISAWEKAKAEAKLLQKSNQDFYEQKIVPHLRELQELKQWKTWSIIEIAVRNPNVASYMEHWEGRALKAEAENDKLRDCIRELLKGGEHEGECGNDQGMQGEGGACMKHCEASDAREKTARKLLERDDHG